MYCSAELLDLPSLCAICSVLYSTFIKLSASPFAGGCSGVTLWCLKPMLLARFLKSKELNGGPLSYSSLSGIPCITNTFLSLSHVILQEVDVNCSTTGNLVCLCMITRL